MKKNGLIDDKYELIVKEFQTIISVFYIILVGIGMIFSYSKYSKFGINIFQYSDIFDFLLTPFRDFSIFIFTFLTGLLVYFVYKLDTFTKNKFPKFYSSKYNLGGGTMKSYPVITIIIISIMYLIIFSNKYGKRNKEHFIKKPKKVEILLSNNISIKGDLIGKNNNYIFLLKSDNVKIYPNNSIIEISIIK